MAKDSDATRKKILDFWEKPDNSGEPIGCLCSSFTFHADMFEEECLGRFLGLDSDPSEESEFYAVELESKLSQMGNATIFVDSRHSKGARSPRWNLLPVHVSGGAFHPKLQVLVWTNFIRVIVGSANITREGYRFNDELFYAVDFHNGANADVKFLEDCLAYYLTINQMGSWSSEVKDSIKKFIGRARDLGRQFDLNDPFVEYHFTAVWPGSKSLFEQIKEISGSKIYDEARIESPSFDQPGTVNEPAEQIWDLLRQRGEAIVTYCLRGRKSEKTKEIEIFAPLELLSSKPKRENATVSIELNTEIVDGNVRSAHGKYIEFSDNRSRCLTIGSSNFSRLGLGLKQKGKNSSNFEANITLLIDQNNDKKIDRYVLEMLMEHEEVDFEDYKVSWLSDKLSLDAEMVDEPFPNFISYIQFDQKDGTGFYQIGISQKGVSFSIKDPTQRKPLFIIEKCKKDTVEFPHPTQFPFSELIVSWDGHDYAFPVTIVSQSSLPTPDYLSNLTLEEITELLSSNLPLQKAFKKFFQKRNALKMSKGNEVFDPHKRANTSGFILQRTRQFSWALRAFMNRLERPIFTEESLDWQIHGPIGLMAIKDCLLRPFESSDEKAFFLTEIIGALSSVKIEQPKGALPKKTIQAKLNDVIKKLKADLRSYDPEINQEMKNYILEAQVRNGK